MRRAAVEFKGNSATQSYGPLTALSTRELHLILAEAALATADTAGVASGFATHLNVRRVRDGLPPYDPDRKSTRLNSSHLVISYAVFCLKKKKNNTAPMTCS